ncbi:MAG: hypothetical protein J7L69_04820 [Desulfobulbaceae bacterium]|nr:hypothetical protein [Desulfobulbaceae bacterium]
MHKSYLTSLFLSLLAVAFLAVAASRLETIHAMRKEYKLQTVNPLKDREVASELRLPLVALSTFRSLAIDYLWIRADNLKQEGQYFDALHLARMICVLQPHLAAVWDFQAWNMAYNISVAMPTPPERWNWIQTGYKLLRDEGLVHNPQNAKIYHSLAWIFWHKIGGISDDFHRYYKLQLAQEMTPLLVPLNGAFINSSEDIAAMAQITSDWNELKSDPEIVKIVNKIKAAEPKFTSDEELFAGLLDFRINGTAYTPSLHQVIADNQHNEALKKLDTFIRARILRGEWKLEPQRMLEINNKYGPVDYEDDTVHLSLDWRLPYTHALYWGVRGLECPQDIQNINELNLHRIVYHSLQDLYHYGHLQILPFSLPSELERQSGREVLDTPKDIQLMVFNSEDLRMFPIAYQATLDIMKFYAHIGAKGPGGIKDGSANLCESGIRNLYLIGHRQLAQKYLVHLRERYPDNKDYNVSLDNFVHARMKEAIDAIHPKDASDTILNLLRDAYARYAVGDDENASIKENLAESVLEVLKKEHPDEEDRIARMKLRSFPEMRLLALTEFLTDKQANPVIRASLLKRLEIDRPTLYNLVMAELEKINSRSPDL